jgi:hypothetical protein
LIRIGFARSASREARSTGDFKHSQGQSPLICNKNDRDVDHLAYQIIGANNQAVGNATLRDFCDIAIRVAMLKGCAMSPEDAFVRIPVNDPEYWRKRAKESRVLADEMTDVLAKLRMLKLVQDYEELAIRAEKRLRERQKFSPS